MKKILILSISVFLTFISCKKDEDDPKTKTELLTESVWIFDNQMIDTNINSKPDDEKGLTIDIKLNFKTDGTLEYTLGYEEQDLIWSFESNESIIKITSKPEDAVPGENEIHKLIYQLNASNLIFQGTSASNPEQMIFEIYKR